MMKLETVVIAVHPFSARVLNSVYGQQPIVVDRRDVLFSMLSQGRAYRVREVQLAELTMQVTLKLNTELARKIRKRGATVGLQLAQFHKDWMCAHTATVVAHYGEASAAIRDWYARHGITEDDYALESAYKYWQRYVWRGEKNMPRFSARNEALKDNRLAAFVEVNGRIEKAWTEAEIELASKKLHQLSEAVLAHLPVRLGAQIRAYIYAVRSAQKTAVIARRLNIPETTARRRIQVIRDWLSIDATAREMFEKILAERPEV